MAASNGYVFYGVESTLQEVRKFTEHILRANLAAEEKGHKKTPVCIWGTHGIGKTEVVQQIARDNNYQFVYIAPAQFEEMGDLIGMPAIENGKTVFRAPEWVPTQPGPGVLLIDDVNRADDRILRGIMQLLQNYELVSWKLPYQWQIVLTANPDGGNYSVTPMDDAMLTRMMHITMKFDSKVWAFWAEKAGVDPRGINFVLTYPEVAHGSRTTPRSLVQFFDSISSIKSLSDELPLIQMLASSCLDEETVTSFISYVQQNLSELISPEEIYEAKDFSRQVYHPVKKCVDQDVFRVDIMATICTRLINHLTIQNIKLKPEQVKNIQEFIKIDFLPNDLRLSLLQDLVQSPNSTLKMVMADPEVSRLLLKKM
ncbi:AAA family ATPase [Cytophagaceae bacterium DM2B3-1]|uniref:AAA family ATPase n=1 Tax=Xanthocytophaga flava TaxID=3048013 RepID=A0ABT7CMG0_9BACT|nr:AAA family ATPase [Xanthocytophaga flavus]MDJ1494940.1 AAA family ATPase [Xanthocytophaga flavus]